MAKGPRLTSTDFETIRTVYQSMPEDSKAEAVRQEASRILKRELGLSTVQRELVDARKHRKENADEMLDLDKPFSMGALQKYPELRDYTPVLLMLKEKLFSNSMTIRFALWFSRLLLIHKGQEALNKAKGMDKSTAINQSFHSLIYLSLLYASYERDWEKSNLNLPADTSRFDDLDVEKTKSKFLDWYNDRYPDDYKSLQQNLNTVSRVLIEWLNINKDGDNNGKR